MADKNSPWMPYVYRGNNPVVHIDPDGKDWIISTVGEQIERGAKK